MHGKDLNSYSEIIQVDFRRRSDCISAVLFASGTIWERQNESEKALETFRKAGTKHLGYGGLVLLGIYAYQHWESPVLEVLLYVGIFALGMLVSAYFGEFEHRRKLDALRERELSLQTQWVAAGAFVEYLYRFKKIYFNDRDEVYESEYRSTWDATMEAVERRASGGW